MSKIVILALVLVAVTGASADRSGFFGLGAGVHGSVGGVPVGAGFEEGVDAQGNYHKTGGIGVGGAQVGGRVDARPGVFPG